MREIFLKVFDNELLSSFKNFEIMRVSLFGRATTIDISMKRGEARIASLATSNNLARNPS